MFIGVSAKVRVSYLTSQIVGQDKGERKGEGKLLRIFTISFVGLLSYLTFYQEELEGFHHLRLLHYLAYLVCLGCLGYSFPAWIYTIEQV